MRPSARHPLPHMAGAKVLVCLHQVHIWSRLNSVPARPLPQQHLRLALHEAQHAPPGPQYSTACNTAVRRGRISQVESIRPRRGAVCLSHVGTSIYIAVPQRAQLSHQAEASIRAPQRKGQTLSRCGLSQVYRKNIAGPLGLDPPWDLDEIEGFHINI